MSTARIADDISCANGAPRSRSPLVRALADLPGRPALIRRAGSDDARSRGDDYRDVTDQLTRSGWISSAGRGPIVRARGPRV
ncbi:MAG TPA: hypothetical protein DIU07_04175 [Rhodobacteraceae bacterium]|nr:hypothetical protein [Paracoccaceae bacterium]